MNIRVFPAFLQDRSVPRAAGTVVEGLTNAAILMKIMKTPPPAGSATSKQKICRCFGITVSKSHNLVRSAMSLLKVSKLMGSAVSFLKVSKLMHSAVSFKVSKLPAVEVEHEESYGRR
jgi:hypothetical protein